MSMGYYACWAHLVNEDFVREHAGEELENLKSFLENHGSNLSEYMRESSHEGEFPDLFDENNDVSFELIKQGKTLAHKLQQKFMESTGGLSLYTGYHDEAGRGDMIEGEFWCVGNVFQHTPAGEKHKDRIKEFQSWVDFG